MKIRRMKFNKIIIFCTAFLFSSLSWSQSSTPGGSVRLTVQSGGNIDFIFNSIDKYKSGITLTNYTILGISVTDNLGDLNAPIGVDDYTNWRIYAEAVDADGDVAITGTNPANTLPFSTIELDATISAGCASCFDVQGAAFIALPAPGTGALWPIIDGSNAPGNPVDQIDETVPGDNLDYSVDRIAISYQCGVTTSLLGAASDYYTDEILFTLEMNP